MLPPSLLLAACLGWSADEPVLSVTLKFQDSSGFIVKTFSADSLGMTLGKVVQAIRSFPVPGAGPDSGEARFEDDRGVGLCGCEAPYDSLEIVLKGGRREKYLLHCSGAYRESRRRSLALEMGDFGGAMLNSRWDALRARFCRKGYGCSDGSPSKWDYQVFRGSDSAWGKRDTDADWLGMALAEALEEGSAQVPEIRMRVTVKGLAGKPISVRLDSVGTGEFAWGERMVRKGLALPRRKAPEGETAYTVFVWNHGHEK